MLHFVKGHRRLDILPPPSSPSRRILMTRSAADCAGVAGLLQPLSERLHYFQPFITQPQALAAADLEALQTAAQDKAATLAFTSPRSIEALQKTAPQMLQSWRQRLVFAVGPGTAAALQAAGFSHVDAAAGDSADLAARLRLLARQHGIAAVWHLTGTVRAADLAESLADTGMAVHQVIVYHAALMLVPDDLAAAIVSGAITDIVLLSVRVSEHLAPLISQAASAPRLYCLSERIAAAARQALQPVPALIRVAPQPLLSAVVPLVLAPPPEMGND